jgi:deoxycitidine kinase/deoxyguanosine kinase
MDKKIISIEGNIGSGKSSFVQVLKERFSDRPDVCFLQEPVEEWLMTQDEQGVNILDHYYRDQKTYAFPFQMMAYISRLTILKRALETPHYKYIITERCLHTDKHVFCKMLYHDGMIDTIGFKIYNRWFTEFQDMAIPYHYVYLQTDPEVSKQRVDLRARSGETIPIDYLKKCHDYHENWLLQNQRLCIINANQDTRTNPDIESWINIVKTFIE